MSRLLPAAVALLAGCASVPPDAGFPDVASLVHERLPGARLAWIRGTEEDRAVERAVADLLRRELSADAAVQIALLNNRALQVQYEELGVAQADLVQAGLLRNPVFHGAVRFPDTPPKRANLELELTQGFLDLLFLPARTRAAAEDFEKTKLRVAHEVLALAADARAAYYGLVGARQIAAMRRTVVEAAEASAELARRLFEAGNLSELDATLRRLEHEDARSALAKAEAEALEARERLTRLMGLWGAAAAGWTSAERLPDVPAAEPPLERAETVAVARRLDLQALRRESRSAAAALGLAEGQRWVSDLEVGASAERETEGQWVVGPVLALPLPLFDQGQASVFKALAMLRAREHAVRARAVDIRSEVRALRDRLVMLRYRIEHQLKVVIPLRERAVALTLEQYNFMLVGAFQLLEAKRAEYDAYQDYIETVRDYWVARAEFLRALGGPLPE